MATQSGQGMRDQGSMAQSMWGGNQAQPQPRVASPERPENGIAPHGNPVVGQPAPGAPPAAPGTPPPAAPPAVTGAPATPPTPGSPAPALPGGTAPAAPAPRPGPVAPGTVSPSGTPVGPDGGYTNPDGSKDWMPGYGPQMSFGGQETRTGKAPTTPAPPDPDTATGGARGTPQWRAAYAAHDAWIRSQLDAGLHLADLGLEPTRGGGLSDYMKYGSYQPQGGGTSPAPAPTAPAPAGPGTGGGLPGIAGGGAPISYGGGDLQSALIQLLMSGQGQQR